MQYGTLRRNVELCEDALRQYNTIFTAAVVSGVC